MDRPHRSATLLKQRAYKAWRKIDPEMARCLCCGREAFHQPTLCWWCTQAISYVTSLPNMPKSARLAAYDRAFTAVVKARRKYGFPAWNTWQEMDADAEKHMAPEGATWPAHIGISEYSQLRAFVYIINETWGPVPWQNAHTVPTGSKGVAHSDPVVAKKAPPPKPAAKPLPAKKAPAKRLPPKRKP